MKRFTAALIIATLAGLFYVYEEVAAVKVGYTIRKQEESKMLLLDRARALKYNISKLKSPNNLERKLQAQRIVLASPKSWQTLVIGNSAQMAAKPTFLPSALSQTAFFTRFFVGTAQAEARESSS